MHHKLLPVFGVWRYICSSSANEANKTKTQTLNHVQCDFTFSIDVREKQEEPIQFLLALIMGVTMLSKRMKKDNT